MQDGGEALQLLRVIQLKDTIMEATMTKVFVEEKKFHFIWEVVCHEGFWVLLNGVPTFLPSKFVGSCTQRH